MRRGMAAAWLALMAVLATAGPAHAKVTQTHVTGIYGEAFWTTVDELPTGATRTSVWAVTATKATDGATSDLTHEVVICQPLPDGSQACVLQEALDGTSSLRGRSFRLDGFRRGHLDAVYDTQSYGFEGIPLGPRSQTHVVVDWTGRGELVHHRGSFEETRGCHRTADSFRDTFRSANARGRAGTTDLGATKDANLARFSQLTAEATCTKR